MKFADIKYQRPDIPKYSRQIEELTKRLDSAADADQVVAIVLEAEALILELNDMATVASVRYSQDTRDEFYSAEAEYFAEAGPAFNEKGVALQKCLLASPFRPQLEQRFPKVLFTNFEIASKTIAPQVLGLLEEESKLELEYQQLIGSIMVEFDGQKLPMPKMAAYTQSADRAVRKNATTATGQALAAKGEQLDEIYGKMVVLRDKIAKELGFDNFIQLGYLRMTRNCYGPEQVEVFRRQVKKELVPLMAKLKKAQAQRLGLDSLCFYDESVLRLQGNPRPVKTDEDLYQIGLQMYRDMKPETAELINKMDDFGTFDLLSREGKMSGGYCTFLNGYKVPFIFANFSGTAGDVEVFTHEGGHAFQAYLCRDQDLASMISPTYETCEVHSMSMEFLSWPYLDRFYGDNADIAKLIHLIDALSFIPYGCLVDEFQHEMYANPGMTAEERHQTWAKLEREYFPDMDYDGLPFYGEGRRWQRQLHIYTSPFYYIDYCLAQTIALQFCSIISRQGWDAAWEKYLAFTKLGGTLTFTGLIENAGLKSPFKDGALTDIIADAKSYIDENIGKL